MKSKITRGAFRGKRSAAGKRFVLRPPTKRTALLSGTALASGILVAMAAMVAMPKPAMAACLENDANWWTCAGPEGLAGESYTAAGTFRFDFGPNTENPYEGDFADISPGFTIDADGNSTAGAGVHFYPNSYINNEDGVGLYIFEVGDVVVNIDGATETTDQASIIGTNGIVVGDEGEDGGSITINNFGHVEGTDSAAIRITGIGLVNINNHTYASSIGAGDGDNISEADIVNVNNQAGLTAGLDGDGLYVFGVSGVGVEAGDFAANVDNTEGGVFAGRYSGIGMDGVNGGISIQNQATWDPESETFMPGGLIAGVEADGVRLLRTEGHIVINNSLTRQGAIDLSRLDPKVFDGDDGLLDGVLPAGFTTGIYGFQDGVGIMNVDGDVDILNRNGQIVGEDGSGVAFTTVVGDVTIDNSAIALPDGPSLHGGRIWGSVFGIEGSGTEGDVVVDNTIGKIFGGDSAISLVNVGLGEGHSVDIDNTGGLMWGHFGDAIRVLTDESPGASLVQITNGGAWFDYGNGSGHHHEGHIIGGDRAIYAMADKVVVLNRPGGVILGDGQDLEPVMEFHTSGESSIPGGILEGSLDLGFLDAGAFFINGGIAGSDNNPHFDRDWWPLPGVNEFPKYTLDTDWIFEDVDLVRQFAQSGGTAGSIFSLNGGNELSSYGQTASDLLIHSDGGALLAINGGNAGGGGGGGYDYDVVGEAVMFGRIQAFGQTFAECEEGEGGVFGSCYGYPTGLLGNTVTNLGNWFVTNQVFEGEDGALGGTILASEGDDSIYNLGFIQTAFGKQAEDGVLPPTEYVGDYTSFSMDDFYNGGGFLLVDNGGGGGGGGIPSEGQYHAYYDGWLSMVDGDADDETYIFGNFHGSYDLSLYRSFLAVDVMFGPSILLLEEDLPFYGRSDVLRVGDDLVPVDGYHGVSGSTEIVVHKLNETPGGINKDGILVAYAGDVAENVQCGPSVWCKSGDAFFVSPHSPDHQLVSGTGFVRDGMFMWGVQEQVTEGGGEVEVAGFGYYFVSDWGPDAYHQPGLITAAQNAWYASGGVVEDHIYGNVYPQTGLGGGGADLTYYPPVAGPVPAQAYATGYRSAIWGKATGNWANRDTEVDANGLTFDTGFNQDTYSLLGGLEFRPTGDSNLRLGVFGGYLTSKVSFDSYDATATLSGGTVGAYAALTSGAFYVDAEVKGDFLSIDYETPFVDVTTKATSVGVLANVGYRMQSGPSFFEPIASFSFVNTALDDTSGGGASVAYSNGRSVRAGAGARIGTSFGAPGGPQTEVDLLAKVWNEFAGPNEVTLSDGMGSSETFTDGISGVFGEVVGRATMYSADRRTSAFVSAGAEFGKNWTTYSAKAGLRRAF